MSKYIKACRKSMTKFYTMQLWAKKYHLLTMISLFFYGCTSIGQVRVVTRDEIIKNEEISREIITVKSINYKYVKGDDTELIIKLTAEATVNVKEKLTMQKAKATLDESNRPLFDYGNWDKNTKRSVEYIGVPYYDTQSYVIEDDNVPISNSQFVLTTYCNNSHVSLHNTDSNGVLKIRLPETISFCSDLKQGGAVVYDLYCNSQACQGKYIISKGVIPVSDQLILLAKGNKETSRNLPNVKIATNIIDAPIDSYNFRSHETKDSAIAVIIGNRSYAQQKQNVPDVDYAHNDADLMKRYVIEGLGYREGNVIDLRDASQANFVGIFGNEKDHKAKLFSWLRPGESDVFVYYSGHGVPSLKSGQGYLLPIDADPKTVEFNGYPLETLYANLGKLPAKSVTVVIDACFSGNSQAGMVVKNASPAMLKVVEAKAALPNASIFTAASVSEVASWDEKAKLGLFTRHFLDGVTGKADQDRFGNGDGKVTLGELKKYLESEVAYMARRLYLRDQNPQIIGAEDKILSSLN